MKLKEFEAKKLIQEVGIPTSKGILITAEDEVPTIAGPTIAKVQTIANGRGKAGGIKVIETSKDAQEFARNFLGTKFLGEKIAEILFDQKVDIAQEFYLGLLFDTTKRMPVLVFSTQGGVDIETLSKESPEKILTLEIDYLQEITPAQAGLVTQSLEIEENAKKQLQDIFTKLFTAFKRFDCKMIEVNPLVLTPSNDLIAVDCVAVLDDDAKYRREIEFPERTDTRKATDREIRAHQIDKDDHRGVAGKTYLDLDGDIAILTSGGGASMTLMDALVECGGKPANFTEYSGNPPMEKVEKLTQIVLEKENLSGLLIGGVIANFTDIAATLQGVVNILKVVKPTYPIVIRRAGPNDDEAKKMLEEARQDFGLNIHYFDEKVPLTKAAKIMVELSNKYKTEKGVM